MKLYFESDMELVTVEVDTEITGTEIQEEQIVVGSELNSVVKYEPYFLVMIFLMAVISGQFFAFLIMYKWRS